MLQRSVRAHALETRVPTVVEANRRAGFVYGAAPTCHFALAVRTIDYTPGRLDEAVVTTRNLVRIRAMRGSVHLIPRDLVPHALAIVPTQARAFLLKHIGERQYAALAARVEDALVAHALTAAEIRTALGARAPAGPQLTGLLAVMSLDGRIARSRVRGGPRSQNFEYARMADWVDVSGERPSRVEALAALATPWLQANGPAAPADLAWWAAAKISEADLALAALRTRTVAVADLGDGLHATEQMLDELASIRPAGPHVHLLPYWDAYLMAYKNRSRYLDDRRRPHVVDRNGNVTNVILSGGRVVGVWDVDATTLLYAPFERIARTAIQKAAERLTPIHAVETLREVKSARPLADGGQNAFMAPLRRWI